VRLTVSIVIVVVCLALVAVFSFSQGKAYAERKAEVQVANDNAFYSLFALRALRDPQDERLRTLFQASLDGAAIKLSEMSLTYPKLIGRTNYNLLIKIQEHFKKHGRDSDRNPALRPVDQVMAKIAEATKHLESVHDIRQWEDEDASQMAFPETSK
jgi:hypothetical protein